MGSACNFAHGKEEMQKVAAGKRERNQWLEMLSAGMNATALPLQTIEMLHCSPATIPQGYVPSAAYSEPNYWDELTCPDFLEPDLSETPWPPTRSTNHNFAELCLMSSLPEDAGLSMWMPHPPEDESTAFTNHDDARNSDEELLPRRAQGPDGTSTSNEELQGLPLPFNLSSTSDRKPHDHGGVDSTSTNDTVPSHFDLSLSLNSEGSFTSSIDPMHIPLPSGLLGQRLRQRNDGFHECFTGSSWPS